jgi:hypothetical protein
LNLPFWVIHYIRAQKICFHNVDNMGVKRCRILRRFQKCKLTLVTKCTLKKLFPQNMLNWDLFRKSPNLACFLGITFFRSILSLSQTNFYVIFPSFLRYTTTFKVTFATVPISTHSTVYAVNALENKLSVPRPNVINKFGRSAD